MSKNKFTLNFKDWKKVSEDKHHTTMEHKSGHQLKLAHSQLSPENRKALSQLPAATAPITAGTPPGQQQMAQAAGPMMFGGGRIKDTSAAQANTEQFQKGFDPQSSAKPAEDTSDYKYTPTSEGVPIQAKARGGMIKSAPNNPWVQKFADGTDQGTIAPDFDPAQNSSPVGAAAPTAQPQQADMTSSQPAAPTPPAQDPSLQRKRDIYNHLITNTPLQGAESLDPNAIDPTRTFSPDGAGPTKLNPGTWDMAEQQFQREKGFQDQIVNQSRDTAMVENKARIAAGMAPIPVPAGTPEAQGQDMADQAAPSIANGVAQGSAPPMQQDPLAQGANQAAQTYGEGYNQTLQGMRGAAGVQQELGNKEAAALGSQVHDQQNNMLNYQKSYNDITGWKNDAVDEIHKQMGELGPDNYIDNMSTGKRIRSMLGLIVGGFGGGLAGGSNQALDFLNKQIDRDIATKTTKIGAGENLLSAAQKQFGNLRDATDMHRVISQDMVINKLKQLEATSNSQAAKFNLQKSVGALQMDQAMKVGSLATRQGLLAGVGQGTVTPERFVGAAFADAPDQQKKAQDELGALRNMVSDRDTALNAYWKIASMQNAATRAGSPIQSTAQIEQELHAVAPSMSKETTGRFTTPDFAQLSALLHTSLVHDPATRANGAQAINNLMMKHMNGFSVIGQYPQIQSGVLKDSRYDAQGRPKIQMAPAVAPKQQPKR